MRALVEHLKRLLRDEDGPTTVEYAIMLSLILVVCFTAIVAIGTSTDALFKDIAAKMP